MNRTQKEILIARISSGIFIYRDSTHRLFVYPPDRLTKQLSYEYYSEILESVLFEDWLWQGLSILLENCACGVFRLRFILVPLFILFDVEIFSVSSQVECSSCVCSFVFMLSNGHVAVAAIDPMITFILYLRIQHKQNRIK